jgi:RNA polymerase sigma-70 factor (ECF subfamily)
VRRRGHLAPRPGGEPIGSVPCRRSIPIASSHQLTREPPPLAGALDDGREVVLDDLVPVVLAELRALARRQLGAGGRTGTLQTTELVHEAYLRLAGDARVTRHGRAYFWAAAARAMRQVLVDAARRRGALKRGGGAALVSLGDADAAVEAYAEDLLALEDALAALERRNPRHARVVECRFFGGLGVDETAQALGVSPRTIKADWALARAWLAEQLDPTPP